MEITRDTGPVARRRLILVAVMLGMGFAVDGVAAALKAGAHGWIYANLVTAGIMIVLLAYLWRTRDILMARLLLLGLVAGFGELFADAWAVSSVQVLTYNPGGPFIWDSPLYMPFAWAVSFVELGYLGYWLAGRWGLPRAALGLAVFGVIVLPGSETLAHYAGFWTYHDVWQIGGTTPVFLVPAEALIAATFPLLAVLAARVRLPRLVLLGVLEALWMYGVSVPLFAMLAHPAA